MPDRKTELRELCRLGRFSEALALGSALCNKIPGDPELWFLVGAVHGALGAFGEAEKCCRKALTLAPDQYVILYNLGIALLRQERAAEAEEILRRARSLQPGNAEIITALADSVLQQGRPELAISLYQETLAIAPSQLQAINNIASAYQRLGQYGAAESCYRQLVAAHPKMAGTYLDWSRSLIDRDELTQGLAVTEQGLAQLPSQADLRYQLGFILSELGRHEEALRGFEACLAADPGHVEARFGRAMILRHTGRLTDAASDLQLLLDADERNARAHASLSGLFLDEGRIGAMLQHDRRAVELDPTNTEMQQHLLMDLHYSDKISPQELYDAHRVWGESYGTVPDERIRHANEPDPERVLRIGYVSCDFRLHSVAHFIEPVLTHRDQAHHLVYCYSNLRPERHDATTSTLREAADLWRDVFTLSDRDLSTLIAADGIDILVDLSGHTSGNRLGAFMYRPAPVQMSWLGYPDTTGLPAMDYRLTDEWADPAVEADDRATETLLRIPDGFLCYSPPTKTPDCGPPPHLHNGFVTFGSLNNLAKVNDSVVTSWSTILRSVPGSRLLLKGAALADVRVRERIAVRFGDHGVEATRLVLLPYIASTAEHLACYQRMDIALDTFPYNGTTTTCEALWMGVPVMTLAGPAHAGRVGLSLLHQVGLSEFAAASLGEYEAGAIDLANDGSLLATLHESLRNRMRTSPLMDGEGFCMRLESRYRQAWRLWCKNPG